MSFSSLTFIFVFLPIVLLLYYITPKHFRNIVLLLSSLFFYAWGASSYIYILLSTIVVNYIGALFVQNAKTLPLKRLAVGLTVTLDLLVLMYFKYFNFFAQNINQYLHGHLDLIHVLLPLGISFYTFMAISYVVDVFRQEVPAQKNILRLALYLSNFTYISAGPIVKYHDIISQLDSREEKISEFIYGVKRFIIGLAKKVLIANTMAELADKVFALPPSEHTFLIAWLGVITYGMQLYFDFSGYSDMAVGVGRMFGLKIMENFNFPYISKSFTEFWRRWHISLSTWFKYYLYIPLGGNRKGKARTYFNLFIVFLVTGFWHGASWTYIVWGIYHGFFMVIEKFTNLPKKEFKNPLANAALHIYCMGAIFLSWPLFRAENIHDSLSFMAAMFDFTSLGVSWGQLGEFMNNYNILVLILALIGSTGILKNLIEWGNQSTLKKSVLNIYLAALFFYSWCALAASTYTPFIYFKF